MKLRKSVKSHSASFACLFGIALATASGLTGGSLTVTEAQAKRAAIKKTAPAISAMAQQYNVSGRVEVSVMIDEQGSVTDVKVINGNPMLASGVIVAVKQWKFTPFTQDGAPTTAKATLSFDFKQ